jgi:lambda repressor-like predicted transcriptional regulator
MKQNNSQPDIALLASGLLKQRGSSLRALSLKMGRGHNYLSLTLRRKELPIQLLIELSNALGYNFVELYLPQLHAHLRPTAAERALQQQLAEQAALLQRTTEERDRYWKVIEGRAK